MHVFGQWEEAGVPRENPRIHTERSQLGVEPGTLSLWGDGANHHTTVQPESGTINVKYSMFSLASGNRYSKHQQLYAHVLFEHLFSIPFLNEGDN